jgi:hypothetical protein
MIFQNFLIYFGIFSLKIWPFSPIENLAFFKLLKAKFGLFYFLGPGKPAHISVFCKQTKNVSIVRKLVLREFYFSKKQMSVKKIQVIVLL